MRRRIGARLFCHLFTFERLVWSSHVCANHSVPRTFPSCAARDWAIAVRLLCVTELLVQNFSLQATA